MKLRKLSWLPAAFLMIVIFYFSSKTADLSEESSLGISRAILHLYETITKIQWQEMKRDEVLGLLDHIVRKTAHFTEYGILAASIAFHFIVWKKTLKQRILWPILIAGLYAATDEYHQTFIAGRSGQLSDVLLDTAGAAAGTLIFVLLICLIQKKRRAALPLPIEQQ